MTDLELRLIRLEAEATIRNELARYARSVDRKDWKTVRDCYHEDATDQHGTYSGGRDGFIEWVDARHAATRRSVHFLGNIMIDWINTENAFVETYFVAMKRQDDPEPDAASRDDLIVGRYLDHFQKRENNWRVANRMVVYDLTQKLIADGSEPPMNGSRGRRDSNDPAIAFRAKIATQ